MSPLYLVEGGPGLGLPGLHSELRLAQCLSSQAWALSGKGASLAVAQGLYHPRPLPLLPPQEEGFNLSFTHQIFTEHSLGSSPIQSTDNP